jgi:hypothetical protein
MTNVNQQILVWWAFLPRELGAELAIILRACFCIQEFVRPTAQGWLLSQMTAEGHVLCFDCPAYFPGAGSTGPRPVRLPSSSDRDASFRPKCYTLCMDQALRMESLAAGFTHAWRWHAWLARCHWVIKKLGSHLQEISLYRQALPHVGYERFRQVSVLRGRAVVVGLVKVVIRKTVLFRRQYILDAGDYVAASPAVVRQFVGGRPLFRFAPCYLLDGFTTKSASSRRRQYLHHCLRCI